MKQKYELINGKLIVDNLNLKGGLDLSDRIDLVSLPDNLTVNGPFCLGGCTSLKSLPVNLTVNGYLGLSGCLSLESIHENLTVNGDLDCRDCFSLASLPYKMYVGNSLRLKRCASLVSIQFNTTIKRNLYIEDCPLFESLPDNLTIEGDLILEHCISLRSLPKNLTVGWCLNLNGCTSLVNLSTNPKAYKIICDHLLQWKGKTYSFFDGIEKEVIKHRGNVYWCADKSYIVSDGQCNFSHGKTLKEAKADLVYKLTKRDLSDYENITLESELTFTESIQFYRSVTGACSEGARFFVNQNKGEVKDKYTVAEILTLTDGAYGSGQLREFLKIV